MKERPILFSTPMVQAIMEGRKTMTRRVVKPQPEKLPGSDGFIPLKDFVSKSEEQLKRGLKTIIKGTDSHVFPDCPYGQPGDVLWVRETFMHPLGYGTINRFMYKADDDIPNDARWKPSIHMPKDSARIWLRITNVRVERVEDISSADCINEGISKTHIGWKNYSGSPDWFSQPRDSFKSLWESINGQESWRANPWVWVVEFERIEKPENA